ncbi:Riboflavin biosynthesis ribBA [Gossypium arboreum]|uniref:Riboflavin biosynthesis ribBA n=1 Tax=Gossypium arboreum TaxID=29729 RepID=A0A0B0PME2_GOSAR|nr:Riboflavin biosynthesis ribBA [Gossypium arboreum]
MFPNEFFILASIRSQKTSDPLCMILYTCCDGRPGLDIELCRDPGLPIVAGIIPTIASGNASEDRGNTALGDNVFSSEQAFLLRIISEILNEELIKAKSGLPTGSTSVDVMGYSLIFLRDICAQDGLGDLKKVL